MRTVLHYVWLATRALFFALPGIIAFLVAAFSLAVFYMEELQTALKDRRRVRWAVATVLVVMGVCAFISDQTQKAQEKADRQQAIEATADRVAKRTTENVTEAMGRQYGGLVTSLTTQVGTLQRQLAEQGKRVEVIGQRNIVTGKKPVAVVVTNQAPTAVGNEPPLDVRIARIPATSNSQYGKNAVQFILTTNKVMNGGRVWVSCSKGKIKHGNATIAGGGVLISGGGGVQDDNNYVSGRKSL